MVNFFSECVVPGFLYQVRIDFDPDTSNSVFLCRLNDDATVTTADIVDHITALHPGHVEHAVDDIDRRRHERNFATCPDRDRRAVCNQQQKCGLSHLCV